MKALTDEQLERVRTSVRLAYWTATKWAYPLHITGEDLEEAKAEAVLVLFGAAAYWRPDGGAPWGAFAVRIIRRELTVWNRKRRVVRIPKKSDGSAPPPLTIHGEALLPEDQASEPVSTSLDLERALAWLRGRFSEEEISHWIALELGTMTLDAAGKSQGISREGARQRMLRIREAAQGWAHQTREAA